MSKLKILQVNKLYHPWIGGIEKVVQDIAEGLKDRVDMDVLVCQPKGKGSGLFTGDVLPWFIIGLIMSSSKVKP